jgi:hypothetical protein
MRRWLISIRRGRSDDSRSIIPNGRVLRVDPPSRQPCKGHLLDLLLADPVRVDAQAVQYPARPRHWLTASIQLAGSGHSLLGAPATTPVVL